MIRRTSKSVSARKRKSPTNPAALGGELSTLYLHAVGGIAAGYFGAAACAGAAYVVDLIHRHLPIYFFMVPLVVIGLLAVGPATYGFVVGSVTAMGAVAARHRDPASAGATGLAAALVGFGLFFPIASLATPVGQSFFPDILFPFVRTIIGGCFTFGWGAQPKPIHVPAWLIYAVLSGSLLLGLLVAYGIPDEKVRTTPFCEQCQSYLSMECLWEAPPGEHHHLCRALRLQDFAEMARIPFCTGFTHRLAVELWQCECSRTALAEITAYNGDDKAGRLCSVVLKPEDVPRLHRTAPSFRGAGAVHDR
ncbi:MAG: hypothetical protein KatS3mg105_1939 [Gemmatales bacterium]|nr:MAG: hypothetical protein KatS3mg105_1939 [Gemmatales bacterium]